MNLNNETAPAFHCPRWAELPAISLYMDQVIIVLEDTLKLFAVDDERIVTPAMVNNYVKHKIVPAPEKKKYNRPQLATLTVVSILKRALSMSEITALVNQMTEKYGAEKSYDLFCEKLEEKLQATFAGQISASLFDAPPYSIESALEASLTALMGRLYLQVYLASLAPRKKNKEN